MTPEAAEEYTQSLGQIVAGSYRQIVWADTQGIPKALGMSTREWVEERLGGYVRLSIPERREAVAELVEEGMTKQAISDALGVARSTVSSDANANEKAHKVEAQDTESVDSDGRIAALSADLAERVQSGATSLDEAEHVAAERQRRIDKYVREVRDALDIFSRMVGHPVPSELRQALSVDERKLLSSVLGAMKEETRARAAA